MSYQMKKYEDLDITDNFMFAKVFSNEDVAKDFLQDILKISIDKISVVAEATTQEDPFHRSVRFDVLVKGNCPTQAAISILSIVQTSAATKCLHFGMAECSR